MRTLKSAAICLSFAAVICITGCHEEQSRENTNVVPSGHDYNTDTTSGVQDHTEVVPSPIDSVKQIK